MRSLKPLQLVAFLLILFLLLVEIGLSIYDHSILCSTLLANSVLLIILMYRPLDSKSEALFFRICACVAFVAILFVSITHAFEALTISHGEDGGGGHEHHEQNELWRYVAIVDTVVKSVLVLSSLAPSLGLWRPSQLLLHTLAPLLVIAVSIDSFETLPVIHWFGEKLDAVLSLAVVAISIVLIIPAFSELKPYIFVDSPPFFNAKSFQSEINSTFAGINCSHIHVYRLWPDSFEAIIHLEVTVDRRMKNWGTNARHRYEEVSKYVRSALCKGGAKKVVVEPKFVSEGTAREPWSGCVVSRCQKDTGCCLPSTPTITSPPDNSRPSKRRCANDTEVIDYILDIIDDKKHTYNKYKLPNVPVDVRVEMWVQEVTSVSEMSQDFEIDVYMNEFWQDPGLVYEHLNPCHMNISFDHTMLKKIWTPNTCFVNSKKANIHSSPFINIFLMIFPNGSIWSNWRIKSTGPCAIDLSKFPMDSIECILTFESFNYNNKEVVMRWTDVAIQIFKNIELPDFTMLNHSLHETKQVYAAGYWDELSVKFPFRRRYGWYLLQGYIPTYMTTFISWIPFYLGPKAIPARTMIGVNALLAMTFQFGNIIRNLPRVNYVKAIDVWMMGGIFFVFASLIELALIGFSTRGEEGQKQTKRPMRRWNMSSTKEAPPPKKLQSPLMKYLSENLDLYARILFPCAYSLYNFIYWCVYMRSALQGAVM
ncbi:unnamed protein product, partial [Mesorhabditis belari]|uniref:Uncharacterized protein n=1 Tax=Mesorhabditis belari TaxID=2138241 RepID=A0AAF3EH59_9BILA